MFNTTLFIISIQFAMGNKISKKSTELKRKIYLKAAVKHFEEFGYENANMSKLAKELKISVGTLYKVFDNKENLYFEYILHQIDNFVKILNDSKTNDPIANLKHYLEYKYNYFITNSKSIELSLAHDPFFFHKLNTKNTHPMDKIFEFLAKQFKDILKNDKIDYKHIAILFKKLSDGYTESYRIKEFDTSNVIDDTIKLFLNGILSSYKKE